jgi:hypothetical protein
VVDGGFRVEAGEGVGAGRCGKRAAARLVF